MVNGMPIRVRCWVVCLVLVMAPWAVAESPLAVWPHEVAQITFSTGLTGRVTYDPILDVSRATFSDGSWSRTTHNMFASNTTYSDGRTSRSTYVEVANRINTTFSDGSSATTTFNDLTNTVRTTFSNGDLATIRYVEAPTYVPGPVCGLFLMPGRSNIVVAPENPAVLEIKRLRAMTPEQRRAGGWMRSGD
jgi:hypothetical protein